MKADVEPRSKLRDTAHGYGWISIALHWATAAMILTLLFVGDSIDAPGGAAMLAFHTSLAVTVYAVLWARIAWRLVVGHPGKSPKQGRRAFWLGKLAHYVLLAALTIMLVSGPLLAWSAGVPLRLFGLLVLPALIGVHPGLSEWVLGVHAAAATTIAVAVTLHVIGVFKHMLVDGDETFDRMMVAGDHDRSPPPLRKSPSR